MQEKDLAVIVLAAGKGRRMKSDLAKVLHLLSSRPLLAYVLGTVSALKPQRRVVVVGHQAEAVKSAFTDPSLIFVEQTEQLGTGHAVQQAEACFHDFEGDVLILCGDMPLMKSSTLEKLVRHHRKSVAGCTLLSLKTKETKDFGRVVRNPQGGVARIVEHRDASAEEITIDEYNSGVYCFSKDILFKALGAIDNRNSQNEYYLTDTIDYLTRNGHNVQCVQTGEASEIFGINSLDDLKTAETILQQTA